MSNRSGFFVVLEGIDGAGTTSQVGRVSDHLVELGYPVVTTQEPRMGCPVTRRLRQYMDKADPETASPADMAILFAAQRVLHLNDLIMPALAKGKVVISDRYVTSTRVYQGQDNEDDFIDALTLSFPDADREYLLDLPEETASVRLDTRGAVRDVFEGRENQVNVRQSYLFESEGNPRSLVVLANRSRELVTADIISDLLPLLRKKLGYPTPKEMTPTAVGALQR